MTDSTLNTDDQRELDAYIDALCDERLNQEGFTCLNDLLDTQEAARRHYLYRMDLHHTLRWNGRALATHRAIGQLIEAGVKADDFAAAGCPTNIPATTPAIPTTASYKLPQVSQWTRYAAALVLLTLSVGLWIMTQTAPPAATVASIAPRPMPTQTIQAAAYVRQTSEAQWNDTDASTPHAETGALPAGNVHLQSGVAQIELISGTMLTVQGPARLEILGDNRVILLEGTAVALTPPRARGFVLLTKGMKVTDAGSEFGVHVDLTRHAKVAVFRGEVHTFIQSELLGEHRARLTRDDGLTLDLNGSVTTAIGDASRYAALRQPENTASPTVANPGFEYPRAVGKATHAPAGWTLLAHPIANADQMDIRAGLMIPTGANQPGQSTPGAYPRAAEGRQWAYLNARAYQDGRVGYTSMHQAVGDVVAGATYQLELTIAAPGPTGPKRAGFAASLWAGSHVNGPTTLLEEWRPSDQEASKEKSRVRFIHQTSEHALDRGRVLFLVIQAVPAEGLGVRQILVDDIDLRIMNAGAIANLPTNTNL